MRIASRMVEQERRLRFSPTKFNAANKIDENIEDQKILLTRKVRKQKS